MSIDDLIGMEDKVFDSETLEIDLGYIRNVLAKHMVVIASCLVISIIGGAVVGIFVGNRYTSEATMILNPIDIPNILTNYRKNNTFFQGYTARSNPFKNQEELLNSRYMAEEVWKALAKSKDELQDPDGVATIMKVKKMLKAKHVRGTDFIKISVTAKNEKDAMFIAGVFRDVYKEEALKITKDPLIEQEKILTQQRDLKSKELTNLNDTIKDFQAENKIVDLSTRGRVLVEKLEGLNTRIKDAEALAGERAAEVAKLQSQLDLKAKEGLKSVARGQNSTLQTLQHELDKVEQDYHVKALTYAPTNPMMVELSKKIEVLKGQVADQQIQTVGLGKDDKGLVIKDRVRSDLVLRLATREAEAAAVQNRASLLRNQNSKLREQLAELPATQVRYAELLLQRKDLEDVLTRIKAKLTEVNIQLTGLSTVVQSHDPPSDPGSSNFPNPFHIIVMFLVVGGAVSSVAVVAYETFKNQIVSPRFVERGLQIPVLAMVPWTQTGTWKTMRRSSSLEVLASPGHQPTIKAYHTLALNLKHQANINGKKCISVASIYKSAEQANMLANAAVCMAQSGDRVCVVDANLGNPRIHEAFGHGLNYEKGLTELINDIAEAMSRNDEVGTDELAGIVQKSLLESNKHPDLHYINAGVALDNTFEFLNSKGFKGLVSVLREHYDWVFFDTPPLLSGADSYITQNFTDGLVMMVERDATDDQILLANKKVMQINGAVIGAVLREHIDS